MRYRLADDTWMELDDVGHGIPLVLLHAFPFARSMWRPQVEGLRDICRLIVPDLRGFGGTSPFVHSPSVDQMADDVAQLVDALNLKEAIVLAGLSMGGYVALAFARRHAERLRGLILADTRAEGDTPEGKANRDQSIAFAQTHSAAEFSAGMLDKVVSRETLHARPNVVAELRQIAAAQSPAAIVAALQALRDRPDARPVLATITVPTLVLVGSDDSLTPLTAAQTIANGIAGAALTIIPEAGHLSNLENPEAYNAAVRGFVARFC